MNIVLTKIGEAFKLVIPREPQKRINTKKKINNNLMNKVTTYEYAYIAGFLDGDGSLMTQIVKNETHKYEYTFRISIVFYQKSCNKWILIWLKDKLKYGSIRDRKDGMSEYCIVSAEPVKSILLQLKEYIRLKKNLLNLVLKIIEDKRNIKSINDFIEVCKLVDKTQFMTLSKKRRITSETVIKYFEDKGKIL